MLIIHIEGNTIEEVRAQAVKELQLELAQQEFKFPKETFVAGEAAAVEPTILIGASIPGIAHVKRGRKPKEVVEEKSHIHTSDLKVEAPVVETSPITIDQCKDLLRKIIAKDETNMTEAKNLLANFGVKKISELDSKNYPAFISAANVVING